MNEVLKVKMGKEGSSEKLKLAIEVEKLSAEVTRLRK